MFSELGLSQYMIYAATERIFNPIARPLNWIETSEENSPFSQNEALEFGYAFSACVQENLRPSGGYTFSHCSYASNRFLCSQRTQTKQCPISDIPDLELILNWDRQDLDGSRVRSRNTTVQ
jgi:hypothetical protein